MKLGILSTSMNCYGTRRLSESSIDRGHQVKVLNMLEFSIDRARRNSALFSPKTADRVRRGFASDERNARFGGQKTQKATPRSRCVQSAPAKPKPDCEI